MQTFGRVSTVALRRWVLIAATYFAIAAVTIRAATDGRTLAMVWAADAAVLAVFLLARPTASLRLVLSAGLVGNVAANVVTRGLDPSMIGYGVANMLGVGLAGWLLRRRLGRGRCSAVRPRSAPSSLSPACWRPRCSALPGAATAWIQGAHNFGGALAIWFLADALGMTVFTPLFVALLRGEFAQQYREQQRARADRDRRSPAAGPRRVDPGLQQHGARFPFMLFGPVTLVTFRGGRLALKAAVAIASVVGITSTLSGAGRFTVHRSSRRC
ncbi:MASE1 domain-containing protein [Sphingomonas sp. MMS24-JH45]